MVTATEVGQDTKFECTIITSEKQALHKVRWLIGTTQTGTSQVSNTTLDVGVVTTMIMASEIKMDVYGKNVSINK